MKLLNPSHGVPWTLGKDRPSLRLQKFVDVSGFVQPPTSHSLDANHPASCGTTTHQKFSVTFRPAFISPTTLLPASSENAKRGLSDGESNPGLGGS